MENWNDHRSSILPRSPATWLRSSSFQFGIFKEVLTKNSSSLENIFDSLSAMFGFSPVVTVTIQSVIISFCSCLVALYLTPDHPPHFPSLLIYSALATPPNFWWQQWLEAWFPGYTVRKVAVDDGGRGVEVEKLLNVRNTCTKVVLDQTIGAVVNVSAYIGATRLLKGVPADIAWSAVKNVSPMLPNVPSQSAVYNNACSRCGQSCLRAISYGLLSM